MKIYGSKNSRSIRTVWALEEAGATYAYQHIAVLKGEGQSPAFKAINPAGKLPVLVDGDWVLTESVAQVLYVAEKFPQARLMPETLRERAEVHRWLLYTVTELEPYIWGVAQHRFALPEEKRVPQVEPTLAWQVARSIRPIEKALTQRAYIAGDAFTVADIVTTHCLTWALSAKLEGAGEACLSYIARMRERPAHQAATARELFAAEQRSSAP